MALRERKQLKSWSVGFRTSHDPRSSHAVAPASLRAGDEASSFACTHGVHVLGV